MGMESSHGPARARYVILLLPILAIGIYAIAHRSHTASSAMARERGTAISWRCRTSFSSHLGILELRSSRSQSGRRLR
jgi:hypothetical protein